MSFEAICNSREVLVGNPFEVTFQLKNAKVKKIEPPSFNGLQAQGPNIGQSFSYINGRSSTNESYSYYVVANKPGTYKIGSAKVITHKGKTLKSKPLIVKIVDRPSTDDNSSLAGRVFLRTELSSTNVVVGEQVTVDIRIYTQVGIEQTEMVKEPAFENMYSHYLRSFANRPEILVVEGSRYHTQIIRRIVVFPSKPGVVVIEPAIIKIGIASNPGGGMFNPFSLESYTIKSLPVELNVSELGGAVSGFSGAVGNYQMQIHVSKNKITSDDVVELTMRIRGQGDIKQVLTPNIGVDKKYFDQFKPNINEDIREGGGLLGGVKEFQYVLTPKATGTFTVHPKFTYFNSKEKKFITIDTIITIDIAPGKNKLPTKAERAAAGDAPLVVEAIEPEDLIEFKAPLKNAQFTKGKQGFFLGSFLFWVVTILPFLGLIAFLQWKKKQVDLNNISDWERKRNNAGSEASLRLKVAKMALDQGASKLFFNEISKALLGFVSDKYNIPTVELTKDNVRQKLAAQNLAAEKIDSLVSILQTSEMALFAGLSNNESMGKVYQESTDLIQLLS
ncbi:MAG: protein BatD [Aureispira sp.]|nr:protein BatD [Aureispira sp.]